MDSSGGGQAAMPPAANPNPGWSADVERHESDEDSDDSATERDADERAGHLSESAILRLMV